MQRLIKITLFGLALSLPLFAAEFHTSDDCTSMLSLVIADTEIHSATIEPASGTFPQHCRVTAVTHGEPGSNVGVEVRMPDGWNEKILATTRQGYMGSFPPLTNPAEAPAIARGYSIITTAPAHPPPTTSAAPLPPHTRP